MLFLFKKVINKFNFYLIILLIFAQMTESIYIQSAASQLERLQRINNIIDALELQILENVGNEPITEYSLDDGQVKIRTVYRSIEAMTKAIEQLEKIKYRLLNELNGRSMVLRPWQGLR